MVVCGERRQLPRPIVRIVVRIFFLVFVHHHCKRDLKKDSLIVTLTFHPFPSPNYLKDLCSIFTNRKKKKRSRIIPHKSRLSVPLFSPFSPFLFRERESRKKRKGKGEVDAATYPALFIFSNRILPLERKRRTVSTVIEPMIIPSSSGRRFFRDRREGKKGHGTKGRRLMEGETEKIRQYVTGYVSDTSF